MLNFDVSLSGRQVGAELARDAEEMAEALEAMAENQKPSFYLEVSKVMYDHAKDDVREFLKGLLMALGSD